MKRFGSTRWNGGLREGQGAVSTESRALESCPYSFFTRYGEKPGTNPEERRGPPACFAMSFVRMLELANFKTNRTPDPNNPLLVLTRWTQQGLRPRRCHKRGLHTLTDHRAEIGIDFTSPKRICS